MFILNNGNDNLGKFDSKANDDIFLGYLLHGHAYRVYNRRTMVVEESMNNETDHKVHESIKINADDDEPVNPKIVIDQLIKPEKDNQSDENQSIEPQDQPNESGTRASTASYLGMLIIRINTRVVTCNINLHKLNQLI